MPRTLLDMKLEAERRLKAKDVTGALKIYRLMLEAMPLDFTLRFDIADVFSAIGETRFAIAIYQTIAQFNIRAGAPLTALVAIKILEKYNVPAAPLMELLAQTYCRTSSKLGRGVRPAPPDYSAQVRDDIDLNYAMDDVEVKKGLAQMAAFAGNIQNYPPILPPIAIFSTLESEPFERLMGLMTLKRFKHGDVIVQEGTVGNALFFVARGEVKVVKKVRDGDEEKQVHLARLGAGTIFGEMALISSEPRGASVICEGAVDVFALTRSQVEMISAEIPVVAGAMSRFTRDRLISNLLNTNPLFKPFDDKNRKELLARFVGHEVPAKTIFIEQGKPGNGLYLILQGAAEVLTWNGDEYIRVAQLGPGDIAGEISLIHDEPATATVRTVGKTTLLFLARELFKTLLDAVPELLKHFAKMANQRIADTENKLEEDRKSKVSLIGPPVAPIDDVELSDDDIILV
ncbi:MAG: cyclic nucleotide-binding domain-containing protein [Deltaproteobacteria bacterium]|nr:cyclic nucleotide-binding domain-containing protein [Deltaproteobacteria bacterium]